MAHCAHRAQAAWLGALGLAGCLVDADNRCGDNQVLQNGLCRCVEDAKLIGNECIVVDAAVVPEMGQGAACEPTTQPCMDPAFPHCQKAPSGAYYCTSTGCTRNDDCTNGYLCVAATSPSYCRRPYVGQATPCETSADCAGYDATLCSTLAKVCLVRDCVADACDPDWSCYDASQVVPGAPFVCVPNELL